MRGPYADGAKGGPRAPRAARRLCRRNRWSCEGNSACAAPCRARSARPTCEVPKTNRGGPRTDRPGGKRRQALGRRRRLELELHIDVDEAADGIIGPDVRVRQATIDRGINRWHLVKHVVHADGELGPTQVTDAGAKRVVDGDVGRVPGRDPGVVLVIGNRRDVTLTQERVIAATGEVDRGIRGPARDRAAQDRREPTSSSAAVPGMLTVV